MAEFSYLTASRLVALLATYWREIDGACARQGFDPLDLPFDRLLNLVYAWVEERMAYAKDEDRTRFNEWLWEPPKGKDPDSVPQEVIDEEMSLFHAAARQNSPGGG